MEEAEYNQIISDGKSKDQIIAGKPYNWVSLNYGTVAVHVESIYNGIATVTIDGGEAVVPAQRFPELSDGRYHVVISSGKLHKRPARRNATPTVQAAPAVVRKRSATVAKETGPVAHVTFDGEVTF